MGDKVNEKPPPADTLCKPITTRIHPSPSDRSSARRRKMALLQHLPSPQLASRLRIELVILAPI